MQENQELPQGWTEVNLLQLSKRITDGTHQPPTFTEQGIPFVFVKHIVGGKLTFENTRFISKEEYKLLNDRSPVEVGDILYTAVGSYGVAVPVDIDTPFSFQRHIAQIKPRSTELTKYLAYVLNSQIGLEQAHKVARGVAQKTVTLGDLSKFKIPLAPLPEQRRIVAKLEELFSRLDAGVAILRQTQAQLKRYRQSVLHAAVTGELTRAWRAAGLAQPQESGAALLQRIRQERRAQWEAVQVAKRGGQLPLNDAWKSKYEEPTAPDTSELPKLPEGWVWASVAELATNVQYGSSAKTNEEASGIPVYRMGNIVDGKLDSSNFKYLPQQHLEFPDLLLAAGDLLFNRTNSAELVGKSAVYRGIPEKASFASYLIRVQLNTSVKPDILAFSLNSLYGKQWVKSVVTQQVGQANVNGTKLQAFAVPLAPLAEQAEIVAEVERRLSVLDKLERTLSAELTRAERLRQSILHRAFTGQLVPQDPTDEPAAALLVRLQAAPAGAPAAKAKRGRQPKTTQTTLAL